MKKPNFNGHATATDALIAHGVGIHPETVIINADEIESAKPSERPSYAEAIHGYCRPPFRNIALENFTTYEGIQAARVILVGWRPEKLQMTVTSFIMGGDALAATKQYLLINMDDDPQDQELHIKGGDLESNLFPPHTQYTLTTDDLKEDAIFAMLVFYIINEGYEIEEVEHPRNYRRRIERSTGKAPSNHYRVRKIKRTRKRYKASGNSSGNKRPEHLVRGHFRHVEDHPIAHFNGSWWIPAHTRGGNGDKPKGKPIYRVEL